MLHAAADALLLILEPARLAWVLLGCSVGLVIGLLPGLGGTVGMSILLPFVFGMDPYDGVALLIGMIAVVHTGDTFPSVLIGVPGTAGSQATIMDGYPLARQGQGGRALSAAFLSSMIGGVVGAMVLLGTLSIAKPLVLSLGSPHLFALSVFGLSMVAVLSRGSPLVGILSGLFGLLLGTVGGAPGVPVYRFSFGWLYLFDGIPLAVLALGLFALPELVDMLTGGAETPRTLGSGLKEGVRDVLRHKRLVLQNSILGSALGIIPGIGASVIDWVAYGVTKQTSRNSETFGRGDIRGVIGPESANNAKEGGALIPALLFGIPAGGTSAMLLGGLILMGIHPGPAMLGRNLPVTLSIVWTLALSNVIGAGLCLLMSGWIARLTSIPAARTVPFLLILMVLAAYQATRNWGDIIFFLVIGLLGYIMKKAAWSRIPLLIGFVLSPVTERYLHLSISRYGAEWLTFPGVLAILLLTAVILASALAPRLWRRPRPALG